MPMIGPTLSANDAAWGSPTALSMDTSAVTPGWRGTSCSKLTSTRCRARSFTCHQIKSTYGEASNPPVTLMARPMPRAYRQDHVATALTWTFIESTMKDELKPPTRPRPCASPSSPPTPTCGRLHWAARNAANKDSRTDLVAFRVKKKASRLAVMGKYVLH